MGSLAEELSNALDGVDLPSGETEATTPPETPAPEGEGAPAAETIAPAAGEQPGEQPPEQDASQAIQGQQQESGESEQPGEPTPWARNVNTPPATWSATGKAIYATLPEAARREIAKREYDYARGVQQHAEKAKGYDSLMEEFRPYEAIIRSEGGEPKGVIRDLMNTAYLLRQGTPQQRGHVVMQIIQRFGADISPYIGQPEQQQGGQDQDQFQRLQQHVTQLINPVLQKVQTWEQRQLTAEQQQQQAVEQDVTSQIMAFQNATNPDNSPKHLYFENVRGLMGSYMRDGQAQTLDQAYEMACWAHPEVRAALIADQQRAADAKRLEEAKRKANDAKTAGFNVSGQGGVGIAGATQSSLRDELSQQLDAAMGGGRV